MHRIEPLKTYLFVILTFGQQVGEFNVAALFTHHHFKDIIRYVATGFHEHGGMYIGVVSVGQQDNGQVIVFE